MAFIDLYQAMSKKYFLNISYNYSQWYKQKNLSDECRQIVIVLREPMTGVEPVTSSLPRKRSTTELHWQERAENETRTRDPNLGKVMLYQLSYFRIWFKKVGVPGFEPGTPCSQSRCANRTALHPEYSFYKLTFFLFRLPHTSSAERGGFEPPVQ